MSKAHGTRSVGYPNALIPSPPTRIRAADDPFPALESLWDALFPGEDYKSADVKEDLETNDSASGNEIFAPEGGIAELTSGQEKVSGTQSVM